MPIAEANLRSLLEQKTYASKSLYISSPNLGLKTEGEEKLGYICALILKQVRILHLRREKGVEFRGAASHHSSCQFKRLHSRNLSHARSLERVLLCCARAAH